MIRPSNRASVATVFLSLAACSQAPSRGPTFPTISELPEEPRRPDGVVVDPSPELPAPTESARETRGVVALRPPLAEKAEHRVVAAFFAAIVAENVEALADLVTTDATATNRSRAGAPSLLDHWRARLRHFRYHALSGSVLYQDADIESYRYEDLEPPLAGRPLRPAEMGPRDVLLRVPVLLVRAGSDRVFGDEIVFHLRRDKERFVIRQLIEDFQLP